MHELKLRFEIERARNNSAGRFYSGIDGHEPVGISAILNLVAPYRVGNE